MVLVGTERGRVSEARVTTRASFLKYVLTRRNFIAGLVLHLLGEDQEGRALRKSR